ncbi:MAG: FKBP-type peptidyl-prolyl cis-trans isomerase [Bacteroides sp.]|nr:FKBP-type peptidyl-prolyl cis-trans isomerase [Bacteroides sp.]MCM1413775.1 FKBP-type peptidyl-prolyl cis-trans isomerase [Bacteroides sp.]MCM1472206.1 FKBP-type peptidyl-prolyl cis-trans isomerase [Bacteroides sp.]
MSKRLYRICLTAAMGPVLVALSACGSSGSADGADSTIVATTFADSISEALGNQWGCMQNIDFLSLADYKGTRIDVDDFMEGLAAHLRTDINTASKSEGIAKASDVAAQVDSYAAVGVYLSPAKVGEAMKTQLMADTLTRQQADEMQFEFDQKMSVVQNLILERMRNERRQEMIRDNKLRKANTEAGRNFLEEKMKTDPEIKRSASGLAYKITDPGTGEKIPSGSTVQIVYSMKAPDGHIIDSSRNQIIDVPLDDNMIAGLREGIDLLSLGGEGVLYVPASLGFQREVDGVQPGQLIIIELQIKGSK